MQLEKEEDWLDMTVTGEKFERQLNIHDNRTRHRPITHTREYVPDWKPGDPPGGFELGG